MASHTPQSGGYQQWPDGTTEVVTGNQLQQERDLPCSDGILAGVNGVEVNKPVDIPNALECPRASKEPRGHASR
jgi:hypothetical protein